MYKIKVTVKQPLGTSYLFTIYKKKTASFSDYKINRFDVAIEPTQHIPTQLEFILPPAFYSTTFKYTVVENIIHIKLQDRTKRRCGLELAAVRPFQVVRLSNEIRVFKKKLTSALQLRVFIHFAKARYKIVNPHAKYV